MMIKTLGKYAVTALTILCFLVANTLVGAVHASDTDVLVSPVVSVSRDLYSDVQDGLFELPHAMGDVQDVFLGERNGMVVHIQDAHSDYYAQRAIGKIIRYFREKYGIMLVCLEGGTGAYDLSAFADIKNMKEREKVVDFLLKQGNLTAAEAISVKDPGAFLLWGVEDTELYRKNLDAYRENIEFRKTDDAYLKQLSDIIENLKRHIYSKDLSRLDSEYSRYKRNELPFKEYLSYLMEEARRQAIPIKTLNNVYLLKQALDDEEKIDFKKANKERDAFIEVLKEKMSRKEVEELMRETVRYRTGLLSQKSFYNYLISEGKKVGLDMGDYPSFQAYVVYIAVYTSVDKTEMLKDLARLEDLLRESLCDNDEQRELMLLGKSFTLMQKAFGFAMTKDDFDYISANTASFRVNELLSFIKKTAPRYKIRADLPEIRVPLADRLKKIEQFYVYSFARDRVFMEKAEEKMKESGFHSAILVTGGFHTENLTALLRENGFSYITIMPRFSDKKGYVAPYFEMLDSGYSPFGKTIIEAVSSSMLQVASVWNALGLEIDGVKGRNLAMVQLEIARKLVRGERARIAIRGSDKALIFFLTSDGRVAYEVEEAPRRDDSVPDVEITNTGTLAFESPVSLAADEAVAPREIGEQELRELAIDVSARFFGEESIFRISGGCMTRNAFFERFLLRFPAFREGLSAETEEIKEVMDKIVDPKVKLIQKEINGDEHWYLIVDEKFVVDLYPLPEVRLKTGERILVTTVENATRLSVFYKDPIAVDEELRGMADVRINSEFSINAGLTLFIDDAIKTWMKESAGRRADAAPAPRAVEKIIPVADFLKSEDVTIMADRLEWEGKDAPAAEFKIVPSLRGGEKISEKIIEEIHVRAEKIPFIDAGRLADFLRGWNVLVIEDNAYTSGFVDAENKKLYLTETARATARVAPEIVPAVILAEMFRSDRINEKTAAMIGLKEDMSAENSEILVSGLSVAKMVSLANLFREKGRGAPLTDKFTAGEKVLIEINQNRMTEEKALGYGLLDELFGGDRRYRRVIDALRGADESVHSFEGLAEALFKLRPRSWVAFGDIMAGRAREKSMGSNIMDRLSPEAAKMALKTAKEQGVFAYHFGQDEHIFIFPDTYSADDVTRFFLDVGDELRKESAYALYTAPRWEMPADMPADSVLYEEVGSNIHVLVPKSIRERLKSVLENNDAKPEEIYPFLLPAGAVRVKGEIDSPVEFTTMMGKAEGMAGQKWREDEIKAKEESEKKAIWSALTELQQEVVRQSAWRALPAEEKIKYGNKNDLPLEVAIVHGMPGFGKDIINLRELSVDEVVSKGPIETASVLKDKRAFEEARQNIKEKMGEKIALIFKKGKSTGRIFDTRDAYTSYDSRALETLLERVFRMSPEEARNLPGDERVLMVRGPPIDFYMIIIGRNGVVTVLNADTMCTYQDEKFSKEEREAIKSVLKEGLGGRETDYPMVNPEVFTSFRKGEITREELTGKIENSVRMYPFKALNSYVGHSIADDFILAAGVMFYEKFNEILKRKTGTYGGRGNISTEGIRIAALGAANAINASIDEDKFKSLTQKSPIDMMLEMHVVTDKVGKTEEEAARAGASLAMELEAMRAVRDPHTVKEDAVIVGNLAARIRTYNPEKAKEYKEAYDRKRTNEAKAGKAEIKEKNMFFDEISRELGEDLARNTEKNYVYEVYLASGEVLANVKGMEEPLTVFIQSPLFSQSRTEMYKKEVERYIARKYGAENVNVILYDGIGGLEEARDRVGAKLLETENARAVIFCNKDSGIHPKQDPEKDIFRGFKTLEGNPKAYYVEETFDGLDQGEMIDPLIGPHVALAFGIKEFKAGRGTIALMQAVSRLLTDLSGGGIPMMESVADISKVLNSLLASGEALHIRKIDFETLKEQIKAEEAALKSL